jgi:hypothetical protein
MQDVSPKSVSHHAARTVHSGLEYYAMCAMCSAASLLLRGESSVVEFLSATTCRFLFPKLLSVTGMILNLFEYYAFFEFLASAYVILKRNATE